ncbi:hypothetical protein [Microvirga massiliensis]|uniref:hypothetical protein n=1 Tax=Microvirga massiliensis TaxID=1033741 RepID=UPI00062B6248|nr:hypothetical protein [Microvirga massiliensis]
MKKIIDGKRYDTDTATHIANYNNGLSGSDFWWVDEDLYRTPRGNWFVHGAGGAMTRWSVSVGQNSYSGGEGIIPLGSVEAREWCEEHGFVSVLETHFSDQLIDA